MLGGGFVKRGLPGACWGWPGGAQSGETPRPISCEAGLGCRGRTCSRRRIADTSSETAGDGEGGAGSAEPGRGARALVPCQRLCNRGLRRKGQSCLLVLCKKKRCLKPQRFEGREESFQDPLSSHLHQPPRHPHLSCCPVGGRLVRLPAPMAPLCRAAATGLAGKRHSNL